MSTITVVRKPARHALYNAAVRETVTRGNYGSLTIGLAVAIKQLAEHHVGGTRQELMDFAIALEQLVAGKIKRLKP